MSGRSNQANNQNWNGSGGRGRGNSVSYAANQSTSSLQQTAAANGGYLHQHAISPSPIGQSFHPMGPRIPQQYGANPSGVGMWQQHPPTGSSLTLAATNSAIPTVNAGSATVTFPSATQMHASTFIQGYPAMPQQRYYSPQAAYLHSGPVGFMGNPAAVPSSMPSPAAATAPRQKKILAITDKDGKPIDLTAKSSSTITPSDSNVSADTSSVITSGVSELKDKSAMIKSEHSIAGSNLREAVERAIAEGGAGAINKRRKEEEEKLRKLREEEEEKLKILREEEEEKERLIQENLRKIEEENELAALRAKQEAEEQAMKEALENERREAEELAASKAIDAEQERLKKVAEEEHKNAMILADRARKNLVEQEALLKRNVDEREKTNGRHDTTSYLTTDSQDQSIGASIGETEKCLSGSEETAIASTSTIINAITNESHVSSTVSSVLRPGGGLALRPGGAALRPGGAVRPQGTTCVAQVTPNLAEQKTKCRRLYTKDQLLRFRDVCCTRPDDLPDMTIVPSGSGHIARRGNPQWSREQKFPSASNAGRGDISSRRPINVGPAPDQWTRGMRPPQGGRGGRGGRGMFGQNMEFDGFIPDTLKKSENRWVPVKDTSAFVITEKSVKSILNKMTKEKFEKLADQMCEIKILSHDMLTMMIHNIYEKAIYEPIFGDLYATLCVKLSQSAKKCNFVQIIESDEEPPTDDGLDGDFDDKDRGSSKNTVYRWSNDVNTDDSEIVGPFDSPDDCIAAALDAENCPDPVKRHGMELVLHSLKIRQNMFIKIMCPRDNANKFFTVFFPMTKKEEVGQQMSKIFLSDIECVNDGKKNNSFRRSLLSKCEDVFNQQDIYADWKKEKKAYDERKSQLTESERSEKEEELEFRRIKIKKQMLGNIKFIGELYKKDMLKDKVMHYCIQTLLKISEVKGTYRNVEEDEMDEEDHEALCNLFGTIGSKIDSTDSRLAMTFYFKKIGTLSNDKNLSSRSRFMYKDLLELRHNKWKARREEETSKTLDEIKKDFERDEMSAAKQAQAANFQRVNATGGRGGFGRGSGRGGRGTSTNYGDSRDDGRRDSYGTTIRSKGQRDNRQQQIVTEDLNPPVLQAKGPGPVKPAFSSAPVSFERNAGASLATELSAISHESKKMSSVSGPLSDDALRRKASNMRAEFIQNSGNLDDLFFSMDEIQTTPGATGKVIQFNIEAGLECKQIERDAILSILSSLFKKGMVTSKDFYEPVGEMMCYIDSYVIDYPLAIKYFGEILAELIFIKALSCGWVSEQYENLGEDAQKYMPELLSSLTNSLLQRHGENATKPILEQQRNFFVSVLGNDRWEKLLSSR